MEGLAPFHGLADLQDLLADVIARQRSSFGSKACPATEEDDLNAPPDPDEPVRRQEGEQDATSRFAPSNTWRRPSDYVAYMAQRFEEEWTNPRSGKKESRPLKRDQVLFVAQFAQVCNTVWDEDRKVEERELDVKKLQISSLAQK